METSIANTQFITSIKLRKSFVSINIKRTWLNKEKLAKNTSIYQNLIIFSWASISLEKKKKKLWNHYCFLFLSLWLILHKIAVNKTYKLRVLAHTKKANFINNQLECNFFFSSKTTYIYNFPKPKSQTLKDSKRIITFTKFTTSDFNIKPISYRH